MIKYLILILVLTNVCQAEQDGKLDKTSTGKSTITIVVPEYIIPKESVNSNDKFTTNDTTESEIEYIDRVKVYIPSEK